MPDVLMLPPVPTALSKSGVRRIPLFLRDNRVGVRLIDAIGDTAGDIDESDRQWILSLLRRYSDKKQPEYEQKGAELYPPAGVAWREQVNDGHQDAPVFMLRGDAFESALIETGNCMGVVRLKDEDHGIEVQLSIGSRFDGSNRQYFLGHLLSRVFGGSFVSDVDSGPDSFWEMLLAILFRHRLQEASRIGLFRQYQQIQHHDLRFRGKLDVQPYIRRDIPFTGRLSYSNHEITFDNHLNHLVRHASRRVAGKWYEFFHREKPVTDYLHELERDTPSWQGRKAIACMAQNQRPVKHPYYHGTYEPLRKLSLRILRCEGITPYSESDEVDGILFDGAWLWEEYLWTILASLDFEHPMNKAGIGAWNILGARFYPDFFLLKEDQPRIVLDAKYKGEQQDSNDIRQVAGYMHMLDAEIGGLIKPSGKSCEKKFEWDRVPNHKSAWHVLALEIPEQASSCREFQQAMKESENTLKHQIVKLKRCALLE